EEPAVEGERRVVPLDHLGQTREDVTPGILGCLHGTKEMAAKTQHARAERLVELGEALLIAAPGALHGPRPLASAHGPLTSNTLGSLPSYGGARWGPRPPKQRLHPLSATGRGPHPDHTTDAPRCPVAAPR